MSDDEKPEECYSCGYATGALEEFPRQNPDARGKKMWLCGLCAGTLAGNAFDWPRQYPDANALQTICYIGNVILAELRQQSNPAGYEPPTRRET